MKKIVLIFFTFVCLIGAVQIVHAGPLDNANTNLNSAVGSMGFQSDLGSTIGTIVKALLSVVGTIFLLLTIYAGVLWMTAQGNEEKAGEAQGIVRSAVIGLFVVMAAYAITTFVTSKVGGTTSGAVGCCEEANTCEDGVAKNACQGQWHVDSCSAVSNCAASQTESAACTKGGGTCATNATACAPGKSAATVGGDCGVCCF